MGMRHWAFILGVICPLFFSERLHSQSAESAGPAECTLLRERLSSATRHHALSSVTEQVTHMRAHAQTGSTGFGQGSADGSIDAYIAADLEDNGIAPAPKTTDWEFIRRIKIGRASCRERV